MKRFVFFVSLLAIGLSLQAQDVTPYIGTLPVIDSKGVVDKKTKIEGFNDKNTTVLFLVRHAEKVSEAPDADLNAVGRGRALALAAVLKDIKLNGVYSTDRPRTRNTALPSANLKKLVVSLYDAKRQKEWVEKLTLEYGKKFLIVGHSNTIPQLVNILTGKDAEKDIPADDFSNIYIVSVKKGGETKVLKINY